MEEKPAGDGKTKGRQRIEMAAIGDKARRQVTFSKRKTGLFHKASKISGESGATVAVVAFSESGKPFALCAGSCAAAADDKDASLEAEQEDSEVQALYRAAEEKAKEVKAEKERMDRIGGKVVKAQDGKDFWWQTDVEKLGPEEMPEFAKALLRLRENVHRRVDQLAADPSAVPAPPRRLD